MRLNTRVLLRFRLKPSLHSSATCQPQLRGCAPLRELCGIIQVWIELGSIHLVTVLRHGNDPAHPVFMISKEISACRRALGPCPGAAVLQRGLLRKAGAPSLAHRGAAAAAARPGRRGGAPRLVGGSLHCGTDWPGLCHLGSDPTSPHTGWYHRLGGDALLSPAMQKAGSPPSRMLAWYRAPEVRLPDGWMLQQHCAPVAHAIAS